MSVEKMRKPPAITLMPLRDWSFVTLLRSLNRLLWTSVGPNGDLKLLVSGGGYVHLAVSSRHILQHHDQFHNPLVQFIVRIVKNQPDYGLYTGIIITSTLEHQLKLQINSVITHKQSTDLLHTLLNTYHPIFDKLKIKINFDTVSDLIPVVRTVLESKSGVFSLRKSITCLCLQIIKAFLFTLNMDTTFIADISCDIHVYKGSDEYTFFPGIVYQLTEEDNYIMNILKEKEHQCTFKTILFTTALDNTDTDLKDVDCVQHLRLPKIYEILDKAIELGVDLVVCQKVVHGDVVIYLRRRSVIVLERLGTSLAKKFELITGSFPVSTIDAVSIEDAELERLCGVVGGLSTFTFNRKCFLLMESKGTLNAGTLMVSTASVAATEPLKVIIEQALRSLRVLINEPYVLPGAGCFEMSFFFSIQESFKEMNQNLNWLLAVFKAASGNRGQIEVDSCFNHAWMTPEDTRCNCLLISRDTVTTANGTWYLVETNSDQQPISVTSCSDECSELKLTEDAVVDSFLLKRNALIVSFETCINLLNIGTVVCTSQNIDA